MDSHDNARTRALMNLMMRAREAARNAQATFAALEADIHDGHDNEDCHAYYQGCQSPSKPLPLHSVLNESDDDCDYYCDASCDDGDDLANIFAEDARTVQATLAGLEADIHDRHDTEDCHAHGQGCHSLLKPLPLHFALNDCDDDGDNDCHNSCDEDIYELDWAVAESYSEALTTIAENRMTIMTTKGEVYTHKADGAQSNKEPSWHRNDRRLRSRFRYTWRHSNMLQKRSLLASCAPEFLDHLVAHHGTPPEFRRQIYELSRCQVYESLL